MDDAALKRIQNDPNYIKLVSERKSYGWTLSIIMLVVYYGYIALVAFAPSVIGIKIAGVITIGLVLGAGIIVFAIVLTGIYVLRANADYDELTKAIVAANARGGKIMNRLIKWSALGGAGAGLRCGARRGADCGRDGPAGRLERHCDLRRLRPVDARHHLLGGPAHADGEGFLCRRRRGHRPAERPGDRRRLYVGGLVPRHFRRSSTASAMTA